ncbi:unnamed protein product, partial [Heterosigma akashiwo]
EEEEGDGQEGGDQAGGAGVVRVAVAEVGAQEGPHDQAEPEGGGHEAEGVGGALARPGGLREGGVAHGDVHEGEAGQHVREADAQEAVDGCHEEQVQETPEAQGKQEDAFLPEHVAQGRQHGQGQKLNHTADTTDQTAHVGCLGAVAFGRDDVQPREQRDDYAVAQNVEK